MENIRDVKLILIGNSKGIRIPKILLEKYGFVDTLVLEETDQGLLLRKKDGENQLSWKETYREMGREEEDWTDFDITLLDGLEEDAS